MGNCCEAILMHTENDAENLIRESIYSLKIQHYSLNDIETGITDVLAIPLLEVKNSKWITEEIYKKICSKFFIDENISQEKKENQKSSILKYNDCLDGKCFSICLAIWIVLNLDGKYFKDKVLFIEQIILKTDEILTCFTFKKFILRLIEISLFKITNNFITNRKIINENVLSISFEKLITNIFNRNNIEEYKQMHCDKLKELLFYRQKNDGDQIIGLLDKNRNIENEFLKKNFIKQFFIENSYLLCPLGMREHFYNIYSNKFSDDN
jgi:hypothetical protein